MAAAGATIECGFYHPQHLLASHHYSEASTCSCAACELSLTGTGYRCEECGFNIHEACVDGLPLLVPLDQHQAHDLTLTCLLGDSRCCDLCNEACHAGSYMYVCAQCNYGVHPRCTTLLLQQQQEEEEDRVERGRGGGRQTQGASA